MELVEDNRSAHKRRRVAVLALAFVVLAAGGMVLWLGRDDGRRVVQARGAVPTVPTVTVPELPNPVDTSGFRDGWYLILAPRIFTIEDELLLQAARELTIEARNAGYGEAILVRQIPGAHRCAGNVCSSSGAADGYLVILKGPYDVPEWGDSEADMEAEDEWHRTTQAAEVAEAKARGLTLEPGIAYLAFSST